MPRIIEGSIRRPVVWWRFFHDSAATCKCVLCCCPILSSPRSEKHMYFAKMRDLFDASNTYRFGADCRNIRREPIKILAFNINRLTTMKPNEIWPKDPFIFKRNSSFKCIVIIKINRRYHLRSYNNFPSSIRVSTNGVSGGCVICCDGIFTALKCGKTTVNTFTY